MKVTNHHRPLPPPDTRVGLVDTTVAQANWTPDGVQAYLDDKYGKLPSPARRSPFRGYDAELSEIEPMGHPLDVLDVMHPHSRDMVREWLEQA